MLFNPIGKLDLTVRVDREIPISLPAAGTALPLRLVHEGRDIKRASVVQVEILNSGSLPIGEPERAGEPAKTWKLDLRSRDGVTLVPVGATRRKPENLTVDVSKGPSPDIVSLNIGLLNPKDSVALELMLIEPKETTAIPILAQTRIPGLSEPVTGRRSMQERLRDAFLIPLFSVAFLALLVFAVYERLQLTRSGQPLDFAYSVVGVILISAFGAVLLAGAAAWVIAWFAANVLSR